MKTSKLVALAFTALSLAGCCSSNRNIHTTYPNSLQPQYGSPVESCEPQSQYQHYQPVPQALQNIPQSQYQTIPNNELQQYRGSPAPQTQTKPTPKERSLFGIFQGRDDNEPKPRTRRFFRNKRTGAVTIPFNPNHQPNQDEELVEEKQ